jgi:2-polyprenyl-6-hydroxyphenyl methylase/3-demethylubiquinone-9 3-methyltransferase
MAKAKKAINQEKNLKRSTVDSREIGQFDSLGEQWWDEDGPMRPLHRLNPVRMRYIRDALTPGHRPGLKPLKGLSVADIGCGGGLVAEPLCRMGARVTGVDAGKENIRIAKAHAKKHGLDIEYLATTAEQLAASGRKFDAVTALEIVEHVADPELFIASCCKLLKKDGVLVLSTLNRTAKSFALGIVAAEYILKWLPAGTHDWRKFMKPSEIARLLEKNRMTVTDVRGLVYNPLTQAFSLSTSDLAVNYLLTAVKT